MSESNIHRIIIPGLFHLPHYDLSFLTDDKYPKLTQFFSAVSHKKNKNDCLDLALTQYSVDTSSVLPIAQYYSASANVLIATPIHLKTDINSTWIQPAQESINTSKIINDLAAFFVDDIELLSEVDGHFIILFKKTTVVKDLPHYLSVLGKKIDAYQDIIRDHLDWFKLMNEMQMYLHGHELNKTESGIQLFNSLWFWGGDSSQTVNLNSRISCDDPFMQAVFDKICDPSSNRTASLKLDVLKYLKQNQSIDLALFFTNLENEVSELNINDICFDTADGNVYRHNQWKKLKFWQQSPSLLEQLIQLGYKEIT